MAARTKPASPGTAGRKTADLGAHPAREQSIAVGKAARQLAPLESHRDFAVPASRDPIGLLLGQAESRVPELVPVRHGRMLVSPFAYFRGAALAMAADLAGTRSSGLRAQLCGDAHLLNFGAFASPERRLVFDLNDFDETLPGPFEWDIKRLVASMAVAGRDNGLSTKKRRRVAVATAAAYRTTQALAKLTTVQDGRYRIISDPPLIVPLEELAGILDADAVYWFLGRLFTGYARTLPAYRRRLAERFTLTRVARKVVGVGSVGTETWILLMEPDDGFEPLLLQAKQAQRSVLADYAGQSEYRNQGERVVAGQHLMQAVSDIFLGWQSATPPGRRSADYYLRQLRDWKYSAEIESMNAAAMIGYGRMCGWTLARAHARAGDRIAIAAYLGGSGKFDQAVADFAETYADQTERDHAALADAAASGRVHAQAGI